MLNKYLNTTMYKKPYDLNFKSLNIFYIYILSIIMQYNRAFNKNNKYFTAHYFFVNTLNPVSLYNFFKLLLKYKKIITTKNFNQSTTNKKIKNKRIFIVYKKWKNYKIMYKINKLKFFKKNQTTLSTNKLFKYKHINVRLHTYNAKIFKNYQNKKNTTFINKLLALKNNKILINFSAIKNSKYKSKTRNKHYATSLLIKYLTMNLTKKKLIKRFKKLLRIKFGSFLKQKNITFNSRYILPCNVFKYLTNKKNVKAIYFNKYETYIKLLNVLVFINKSTNTKQNLYVQKLDHKFNVFNNLFKSNTENYNLFHTNNVLYLENTAIFSLKYFRLSKKNKNIYEDIQSKINSNNIKYKNTQLSKLLKTSITNYVPFIQYFKLFQNNKLNYNFVTDRNNSNTYKSFFINFLVIFLEKFLKKKLWIRVDVSQPFSNFWKAYIHRFFLTQVTNKKLTKLFNIKEFLEIYILTLQKCDLQFLLMFIKNKLEQSHFKNHKKILNAFFEVIKKNKNALFLNNVKGFSLDIRGKVGVSGNAKKRHIFFSIGKISTTSQSLKSQWQQINIWTPTGQMGVTCLIQY